MCPHGAHARQRRRSVSTESFYWQTEGEFALKLQRPDAAMTALDKSLTLADPVDLHNRTFRLLFRARRASNRRRSLKQAVLLATLPGARRKRFTADCQAHQGRARLADPVGANQAGP